MRSKTKLVLGAAAAITAGPALASPPPSEPAVPAAASYAELLQPIPDAVARLQAADNQAPRLIEAQYQGPGPMMHHHHHHHHHSRSWYRQNGYIWLNGGWILRPRPHHHHHHHHQNPYGYPPPH